MHLQFQTNELTPPPYSYAVEIFTKPQNEGVLIQFEQTYLFRESMDEDDILAEGFSGNDDFKWEGTLGQVWAEHIKMLRGENAFSGKTEIEESEDYWQISFGDRKGYPKNIETWTSFLHEIQQAVFEKAEREAPLQITVLRNDLKNTETVFFEASFADRRFSVKKNGVVSHKEWQGLNPFLSDVFTGEFRPEQAMHKQPVKTGLFMYIGDGLWYELGKSLLLQPSKIQKWL